MALTKSRAKLIQSLHDKKHRLATGLFIVEGETSVSELLASDFQISFLAVTKEFFSAHRVKIEKSGVPYEITDAVELSKIGTFETNDSAIAIVHQRENTYIPREGIALILDEVNDPGNLGTIIRIADWYGIQTIIASKNTVDLYNPKVISATKGSFLRVCVFYTDLEMLLKETRTPVYGAFLDGADIHTTTFPRTGFLVLGNEARGISNNIENLISHKITIPRYGKAESLNVAIATAIMLDNWMHKIQ